MFLRKKFGELKGPKVKSYLHGEMIWTEVLRQRCEPQIEINVLTPSLNNGFTKTFNCLSYLKILLKKLKKLVAHKVLFMFYHIITKTILIVKIFQIRHVVKRWT